MIESLKHAKSEVVEAPVCQDLMKLGVSFSKRALPNKKGLS